MNLLAIAADPMEFSGLLARCEPAVPVDLPVYWARSTRLSGNALLLIANGAGRERASTAVASGCTAFAPDAIINVGFCGALDPALQIGSVVAGTYVTDEQRRMDLRPVPTAPHSGGIYTSDRIAQTSREKAALRRSGAAVVEMEAAGAAEQAERRGLPFSCVRVVTDLAGETFANDFNAALRSDGRFDTFRILRGSLAHPLARVPELLRLRNRCALAARALGDFLADCRF